MGDFKQGILPHWDYMWKDRAGNRFTDQCNRVARHVHTEVSEKTGKESSFILSSNVQVAFLVIGRH